ncbi:MAG: hypothetical protein EBX41_05650 [Chitinophagia bacterium]|nr:hypothetical protein [Chitinophagia bacterium]
MLSKKMECKGKHFFIDFKIYFHKIGVLGYLLWHGGVLFSMIGSFLCHDRFLKGYNAAGMRILVV